MAGSLSDYAENKLLDHVLGTTAYTFPPQAYVSLHTTACTDAAAGTEVSGGSYARTLVDFSAASGGVTANTPAVVFPTATGSWGTITHIGLYDASTAGNYLGWADLIASKTVASGDGFEIPIGDLDVTLA